MPYITANAIGNDRHCQSHCQSRTFVNCLQVKKEFFNMLLTNVNCFANIHSQEEDEKYATQLEEWYGQNTNPRDEQACTRKYFLGINIANADVILISLPLPIPQKFRLQFSMPTLLPTPLQSVLPTLNAKHLTLQNSNNLSSISVPIAINIENSDNLSQINFPVRSGQFK